MDLLYDRKFDVETRRAQSYELKLDYPSSHSRSRSMPRVPGSEVLNIGRAKAQTFPLISPRATAV